MFNEIKYSQCCTFSLFASVSSSAILAHFCQKFGSSKEISVLFPEATKLACEEERTNKPYLNTINKHPVISNAPETQVYAPSAFKIKTSNRAAKMLSENLKAILFFSFIFISWRLITLQYFMSMYGKNHYNIVKLFFLNFISNIGQGNYNFNLQDPIL